MLKRVVLWKLKEDYSSEKRKEVYEQLKSRIEILPSKIEGFISYEIAFSVNEKNTYDIAFFPVFTDMAALDYYITHPDHVKLVQYLNLHVAERAILDYDS